MTISYIDPVQPTTRRLADLKKDYYFDCKCSRCHGGMDDSAMTSVACQFCFKQVGTPAFIPCLVNSKV